MNAVSVSDKYHKEHMQMHETFWHWLCHANASNEDKIITFLDHSASLLTAPRLFLYNW